MSYTLEFLSMLVLFPLIRRSIKCSVFLNLLRVYFDYSQTEDHACVVLLYVFLCSRLAAKAGCLLLVGPQTMLAMCAGLGMRAFVGLLTSPLPVSSPVPSSFCGRCCKFSDCSLQSAEALHRCLQPSIPISLRFAYKIEWPAIDHHLRSGAKKGKTTPHLAYVCIDQHCQRSLSHVNQMVNFRLCPSIKSTIMIYL